MSWRSYWGCGCAATTWIRATGPGSVARESARVVVRASSSRGYRCPPPARCLVKHRRHQGRPLSSEVHSCRPPRHLHKPGAATEATKLLRYGSAWPGPTWVWSPRVAFSPVPRGSSGYGVAPSRPSVLPPAQQAIGADPGGVPQAAPRSCGGLITGYMCTFSRSPPRTDEDVEVAGPPPPAPPAWSS